MGLTSNLYRKQVTRLFSARMKMILLGAFFLAVITLTHGADLKKDKGLTGGQVTKENRSRLKCPPLKTCPAQRVMGLTEVKFENGSAHATAEHEAPYNAASAFILGHEYGWINGEEILPSTIWYEFPVGQQVVPGRVSFRPRQECCLDFAPYVWEFVGSNDETCQRSGKWTVLCQDLSGSGYPHKTWTKFCEVDEKITTEFRCLGILVWNTGVWGSGTLTLKDIRMWKKEFH